MTMSFGAPRSSFSPTGREYVTNWNPTIPVVPTGSPLSSLGGASSPLAAALASTQRTDAPMPGLGGGTDGKHAPDQTGMPGNMSGVSSGAAPTAPGFNFSFGDMLPGKADLASFGGNLVGSTLAGPLGGAVGGFAAGQAAGQGVGKGLGSTFGGGLGFAMGGPIGGFLGSKLGGWAGEQFDPNYGGFQSSVNPAEQAAAQAAALSNVDSLDGYTGGNSGGGGLGSDGSPSGPSESSGGEGMGNGGNAWAKGGYVTKDRLIGPDPHGPDDGYGQLDHGEYVVKASDVKRLGGPGATRKKLAELLARK